MEVTRATHVFVREGTLGLAGPRQVELLATEFEKALDGLVALGAEVKRVGARELDTLAAVLLCKPLKPLGRAPTLLAYRVGIEQSPDHRLGHGTDRRAPRDDGIAAGEVLLVRLRHVLRVGRKAETHVASRVARNAPTAIKDLDGRRRQPGFDFFTHQRVGDRVVVLEESHVVVAVHRRALPLAQLEALLGERQQRAALEYLSARAQVARRLKVPVGSWRG